MPVPSVIFSCYAIEERKKRSYLSLLHGRVDGRKQVIQMIIQLVIIEHAQGQTTVHAKIGRITLRRF